MALINLNKRVTDKWEVRCDNLESPDSFIYIKDRANEKVANPASMEIEVGDVYIYFLEMDNNIKYQRKDCL